jgi:putative molybdopterin biosynthesis protein
MEQKEFHDVVSIQEAKRRLYTHFRPRPQREEVPLSHALGRVAFEPLVAPLDVPPFDRASMDGYALMAQDTFYADEENPVGLRLRGVIRAGDKARVEVHRGECVAIATGAPMPRGANAVVMVEYTHREDGTVQVYRPVAPGENIMAAGADIMRGETVLRAGVRITPRETGVLAALGLGSVPVYRRPRVAIISTGDEVVEPGRPLEYGKIYDVNAPALAHAVAENGGEPVLLGIVRDDPEALLDKLREMMGYDVIIASGGTSAGVGDLSYRVIDRLGEPGILVHGVAIKPGKPTIIGVARGKPIFGLPGYPTSALVVFDVFVAPLLREMAGLVEVERRTLRARAAMRLHSAGGRYEYMPVNLVTGGDGAYRAYPVPTGSGAITTLAEADGYIEVDQDTEMISQGEEVEVRLLSEMVKPADLTIIGSHCLGVDLLLGIMSRTAPLQAKVINVGSSGGLSAVRRGEADIAGTHLLDEATGTYNIPFLERLGIQNSAYLVRGYDREQGLLVAPGNPRGLRGVQDLLRDDVTFINRNPGSGTRVLLDLELKRLAGDGSLGDLTEGIKGYQVEAKSHSAIAAAVAQGRADVGLAIRTVAEHYGLDFIPVREEKYDFAIPEDRFEKPEVRAFIEALQSGDFRQALEGTPGLRTTRETGRILHSPQDL